MESRYRDIKFRPMHTTESVQIIGGKLLRSRKSTTPELAAIVDENNGYYIGWYYPFTLDIFLGSSVLYFPKYATRILSIEELKKNHFIK